MMTISEERNEARKVAALERIASALEVIAGGYKEMVADMEKGGEA